MRVVITTLANLEDLVKELLNKKKQGRKHMELSFLYISFFLTIGSFLLGFIVSWNLKHVYDEWKARAEYAAVVMHPEMEMDGVPVDPSELLYLRISDEDDTIDEDED